MRTFGTHGIVYPDKNYVVPRTEETRNFIRRVIEGKYIVLFAPRQTGKTTFFRMALDALTTEDPTYLPIQLDFQTMRNVAPSIFYDQLKYMINKQINRAFQIHSSNPSESLIQLIENATITDHLSLVRFFDSLGGLLNIDSHEQTSNFKRVVLLIDEFDGIPQSVVSDFLYSLRQIYLSTEIKCPHSVGIVGVKSIAQLDYDRSISPFNIQDEFRLPNFTVKQVGELFSQYTDEIGQTIDQEVIQILHKQTAGQPFLVNRLGQILTEEMSIPKTETITISHFAKAHTHLIEEKNTNISHLTTNIRKDRSYETILMKIFTSDEGVRYNLHNNQINELATYGVIKKGEDSMCEIVNPIYLYCIIQAFKPAINGLEDDYFTDDNITGYRTFLTSTGHIDLVGLIENFRDFVARAGYRILQVPETPQEYVGQHLLLTYLEPFIQIIGGGMFLEVQTGRGKMDLLITHNQNKYVIEIKIWRGENRYQAGKKQLAAYLKSELATEGYYIVFDHRSEPEPREEKESVENVMIRSYVIPVIQDQPSSATN
ncbi:MAG: AAA-like domain-containing protein [Candidatus Poribacteria bacterium]|nr:AAA-like domain-containing protein [Candidatus Poribacteria bacterium]